MTTTPIPDFEELARLEAAATPGPWANACSGSDSILVQGRPEDANGIRRWVKLTLIDRGLIAAARNALPYLLSERETLARELDRMRARVHAGIEMGIEADKRAETLAREKAELTKLLLRARGVLTFFRDEDPTETTQALAAAIGLELLAEIEATAARALSPEPTGDDNG